MLDGVDAADPDAVSIGMPVEASFKEEGEGEEARKSLVFHPALTQRTSLHKNRKKDGTKGEALAVKASASSCAKPARRFR